MIERCFINKNQKIIIVFGLPGAGKTTLINSFIKTNDGFTRLSGGTLINEALSEQDRDYLRKQNKEEILSNQEKLVFNFHRNKKRLAGQNIIFDGHCLIKDKEQQVEVPAEIIRRLEPDLIIFVDEDLETIVKHRTMDPNRPNRESETIKDLKVIRKLQLKICEEYSTKIGVPFKNLQSPTIKNFGTLIQSSLSLPISEK